MNNLLESELKHQMPYLRGGTITETIVIYYHCFLITVIVNSLIRVDISTLANQYYWKYVDIKKEFHLISKYIDLIRKRESRNFFAIKLDDHIEEDDDIHGYSSSSSFLSSKGSVKTSNLGSHSKI